MKQNKTVSRRHFLQGSTAALGGLALTGSGVNLAFGQGSDGFRVGLIGCGGRGTGAAKDMLAGAKIANADVKIVAVGDAFADRAQGAAKAFGVADGKCFVGLDAYQKVLAQDINLVILATPPGFRPMQFEAAVKAGKNVFFEKPVAVCPTGIRQVIAAAEEAEKKGLAVVTGTQRRHQANYVETMKRIHDGMIGEIMSAQAYWNQGGLWVNKRQDGQSDVEWQLRNWLYFVWLSGDHIVEQHVHNLDVINWAMNDFPTKIYGMGGRTYRTGPEFGNIYDHFCIEFEYANSCRIISQCRQIEGAANRVSERVAGTKGISDCAGNIWDLKGKQIWKFEGEVVNPYVQEHVDLLNSIKSGKPLNEGKRIAMSTLTAIMGRLSAYTAREFNASWCMKQCDLDLTPSPTLTMKQDLPIDPVAIPGKYTLEGLSGGKGKGKKGKKA